jgi:predicted TPR repeat methyltransferase
LTIRKSFDNRAAALHDAYAADYDGQVLAYGCYLAETLFGLSYEFVQPGEQLLDLGIGSGLSAAPFAKADLRVSGMDFSPAMLDLCRAKGIAADLQQHGLQDIPWPYPPEAFDHAVCCGVLHFIPALKAVFTETARVLRPGGLFAFTTKEPATAIADDQPYERMTSDGLVVFAHSSPYLQALIEKSRFEPVKRMRCFVEQDIFSAWVLRKKEESVREP